MLIFSEQQISSIKKLVPLNDSKFLYKKGKWSNLNPEFSSLILEYENKEISRNNVIDAYKEYFNDRSVGFMKAFLLTMIWGFADTGYGTYRTNEYISSVNNRMKIQKAIDYINNQHEEYLKHAFDELMEINKLGISFMSKILYFATRAKIRDNYALIFDNRVAVSLIKLSTPNEIFEIVKIDPSSRFCNYQKYNQIMHDMAKKYNFESDQLEMYLFNQVLD